MSSVVQTLDNARAIEFAEKIPTRLNRLQDIRTGHPSILLGC